MPVGLGTAVGYLNLDISGFAYGIDSAISGMNRLEDNFSTASRGLQTIGGMFSKAGTTLAAGLTAPVIGFGAASIKAGKQFDTSMSQVEAVSKATGQDLQTIRDRAIEMGEKTRYSADEVSDAMYYMGLAGWDAAQIYKGIPGVLALGAASGEDLSRVSDIVTDSLTAFGKSADDTSEFVNVLAEASRSSNTTVDMLGESFKYVAPVAGSFGYSLQDTAVALGIFADNGIKSSQAGTGLRQALNSLINPSDKAAAQMSKYGVSLFNADGTTKSLMTVMQELRGTFGNLAVDIHNADGEVMTGEEIMEKYGHSLPTSDMEKLTAIVQIFGVRALPGMLSIINASDESFNSLSQSIYGAQDAYDGLGTAFGMQETMMDNLQGDWYRFTSALGTTKILISDMSKGALRELLQSFTDLINKFNEMDPEQQEQIVKWALIVASIGPVLIVIGKVISGIGSLINTFNTLNSAFSFVSSGISKVAGDISAFTSLVGEEGFMSTVSGLTGVSASMLGVIAVVALLVAAFVHLWNTSEEFKESVTSIFNDFKENVSGSLQSIVEAVNSLGFSFEDITEVIKAAWDGLAQLLGPWIIGIITFVTDTINTVVGLISGVIEIITGIIKGFKDGDWSLLWQGISDIVHVFVESILGWFDNIGQTIWDTVGKIVELFGGDWNLSWEDAKKAVGDWFNSIVDWFKELPGNIKEKITEVWDNIVSWKDDMIEKAKELGKDFVGNIVDFIKDLPGNIKEKITDAYNNVVSWKDDMVEKAKETGSDFLDNVIEFFKQLPYKIGYFIGSVLGTIIKWSIDMIKKAKETGKDFLGAVIEFFKELPGNILDFITSSWEHIVSWSSDMVEKAGEMGKDFLDNVIEFFKDLPGNVKDFITDTWDNVVQWSADMKDKAKETAKEFLDNVVEGIKSLPGDVKDKFVEVIGNAAQWVLDMKDKGKEAVEGLIDKFKDSVTDIPSKVMSVGKDIVDGVWKGIKDAKETFEENIKGFFSGIVDGVKDTLGISSPSKVFAKEIGIWLPPGISNGFAKAMPKAIEKIEDNVIGLVDKTKDILGINSPSKVMEDEVGAQMPPGIANGFEKTMPNATSRIQTSISDSIKSSSMVATKVANKETVKYYDKLGEDLAKSLLFVVSRMSAGDKKLGEKTAQILVDAAKEKWDKYSKTHDTTLAEERTFWNKIVNECEYGSDAYDQALEKYQNANKKLQDSIVKVKEDYEKSWTGIKDSLITNIQKVLDEYENTLVSKTNKIKSQFSNMFSAYEFTQIDDTKEILTKNLRSQVDALEEWDEQMKKLSGRSGVTKTFMEEIEGLGIDATEQMKILNSMSDEELNEYLSLWDKKNQKAKDMAKTQLSDYEKQCEEQIVILTQQADKELSQLEETYNSSLAELGVTISGQTISIGENIVSGIISGIQGREGELYDCITGMCNNTVTVAINALKIHSPSKVFADKIGRWLPLGITDGFVDTMPIAIKEIENSLNNGIDDIEVNDIDVEKRLDNFINMYKNVFEGLVIWFETMEERMSKSVEGLLKYFRYLMYVRQIIDNNNGFKTFIFDKGNDNKSDKPVVTDTSNNSDNGGDTFIFYSPKAINEVQAARMLRNTKRDLAEGF